MWQLDKLVGGGIPADVYRYAGDDHPAKMQEELLIFGWQLYYLDGRLANDKDSFIRELGAALAAPAYAGRNWDALEEVLRDLSWDRNQGYILLYEYAQRFAENDPQGWRTALSILRNACRFWAEQGTPMYVLLRRVDGALEETAML